MDASPSVSIDDDVWSALLRLKAGGTAAPPREASDAAWQLYAPIAGSRQLVLGQVGQSLDGRIAVRAGEAAKVSGRQGFVHLHRCRALVDAVLIGVGTVLTDDPLLTVRHVPGEHPVRVVIDPDGRMPADAAMLHDGGGRVVIVHRDGRPPEAETERVALAAGDDGLDPVEIVAVLRARGLRRLLVEGGARTLRRFLAAGLVDRLHISFAPLIIGAGPAGLALDPADGLERALRPQASVYDLGTDFVFDCSFGGIATRS